MDKKQETGAPVILNGWKGPVLHHAEHAHRIMIERMTEFDGVEPAPGHSEVLRALMYEYETIAARIWEARMAWPLAVGTGKTVSVAAYAAAQHGLPKDKNEAEAFPRPKHPHSMLVSQNTIEALINLKKMMIDFGVPEEMIGLVHQKQFNADPNMIERIRRFEGPDGFASEPSVPIEDASKYPILLMSHQMLSRRSDLAPFNTYNGDDRDIVIYDESMMKSTGRHLDLTRIVDALGTAKKLARRQHVKSGSVLHEAIQYISRNVTTARAAAKKRSRMPLKLETRDDMDLLAYQEKLMQFMTANRHREDGTHLLDFLDASQYRLRVVTLENKLILQFQLVIPSDLKRVIVLDASHNIRELTSVYDSDLRTTIVDTPKAKRFDHVTANRLDWPGGRTTVNPQLRELNSALLRAVMRRVKTYDPNEAVIFFTYKLKREEKKRSNTPSHADLIKRAMRQGKLNPEATISVQDKDGKWKDKPQYIFLTWGQELSISNFKYAKHVLAVGIYRKPRAVIQREMIGQLNDPAAPEVDDFNSVRNVELSELFHVLYQAMGRGHSRTNRDGYAGEMQLDYISADDFDEERWQTAAPGIELGMWRDAKLAKAQADREGWRIVKVLNKLDEDVDAAASHKVNVAANLTGNDPARIRRARTKALEVLDGEWTFDGTRRQYERTWGVSEAA